MSMKTSARAVVALAAIALANGCTSGGDLALHTLSDSEWDSIGKLRSGKYTLVPIDDLATMKQQAEMGKSVGRYQINREGFRTWRLDTATGKICLLLTSDEDWKKPDIQAQSCGAE